MACLARQSHSLCAPSVPEVALASHPRHPGGKTLRPETPLRNSPTPEANLGSQIYGADASFIPCLCPRRSSWRVVVCEEEDDPPPPQPICPAYRYLRVNSSRPETPRRPRMAVNQRLR